MKSWQLKYDSKLTKVHCFGDTGGKWCENKLLAFHHWKNDIVYEEKIQNKLS